MISLKRIIEVLEKRYGIHDGSILSLEGSLKVAYARQHAMHICRNLGKMSYLQIAEVFDRKHPTVMHNCKKVDKWLKESNKFVKEYNDILREILGKQRLHLK